MKRVFSILICAVLLASLPAAPASAETDLSAYSISNGTVQGSMEATRWMQAMFCFR